MMIVLFHPIFHPSPFHPSSLHMGFQIWKIHAPSCHCSMVVQCGNMSLVDHIALILILPIQFHINWQAPTCMNNNCFTSHQLYTPFYCDLNMWMNFEFFYMFVTPNLPSMFNSYVIVTIVTKSSLFFMFFFVLFSCFLSAPFGAPCGNPYYKANG